MISDKTEMPHIDKNIVEKGQYVLLEEMKNEKCVAQEAEHGEDEIDEESLVDPYDVLQERPPGPEYHYEESQLNNNPSKTLPRRDSQERESMYCSCCIQ